MGFIRTFIARVTRTQLETAKFGFYLLSPIMVMYYVGLDTDKKFNLPGFWPDPSTLNQIPKEPHEIQAEIARIRRARLEKRRRLEEKARELGITEDDDVDVDNQIPENQESLEDGVVRETTHLV